MQRCVSQVETEGAPFLHALPANWAGLMRDLGAFTSARKMRSPAALLHALGSVLIVERAMLTPAVQKHIDSPTTRSRGRASASMSKRRSSDAPGR